uniref:Uncharacterized protein n=1 Tax=Arundo donax TaxID=35708 RepID=A0A0A9ELK1_ARUDO
MLLARQKEGKGREGKEGQDQPLVIKIQQA